MHAGVEEESRNISKYQQFNPKLKYNTSYSCNEVSANKYFFTPTNQKLGRERLSSPNKQKNVLLKIQSTFKVDASSAVKAKCSLSF